MGTKVYFAGDTVSFLANALAEGLEKESLAYRIIEEKDLALFETADDVPMMVLFLNEDLCRKPDLIKMYNDICASRQGGFFFVGYEDQIDQVSSLLSGRVITEAFRRPTNAREIILSIKKAVAGSSPSSAKKVKRNVLVVDDSGAMLRTVKSWLEDSYNVDMVNSAVNAITYLSVKKPDLILLDYEMPICSGPQMLQMIRAEETTRNIPVIFLTSKSDKESIDNALSLRPEGYILKSQTPERIIAYIDSFMENRG